MHVSNAQITVEIELDLTGYIDPAEPMTRDYPGCDAIITDIDVDYVYIERFTFKDGKRIPNRINLLDGVDAKNPEVQKLLNNILAAHEVDVESALMMAA